LLKYGRAFSNLVADNQYAVLGLMLLGSLARIQKIVEPYRKEKDDKGEDQGVISDELLGNVDLDLGEVIERVEDMDPTEQRDEATHDEDGVEIKKSEKTKRKKRTAALASKKEPLNRAVVESTPSKQPKKKRKKGDFIDDLFDSIV
jgi:ribonuclease MRP protein subunit RMP1